MPNHHPSVILAQTATPQATAPEAVVPPPSTVGRSIEQGLDKLGQAAHEAARDLGAAAGKAADQAAAKLGPAADAAQKSLETTARDLEIAAKTVKLGCSDGAGSAWDALTSGQFGLAGDAVRAAAGACSDSLGASLMAILPWAQ